MTPKVASALTCAYVGATLFGLWSYGLLDLDEGIYAAALTEMWANQEWLVPTLHGVPFFEKPILIYWLGLISETVGLHEVWTLRLTQTIFAIGTLVLVYRYCVAYYTAEAGRRAVVILASCLLFAGVSRMFIPDSAFVFFLTASLMGLRRSVDTRSVGLMAVAGLCLGAATLAKGPAAIVIAFGVWIVALVFAPRLRSWSVGGWVLFLLGMALVAGSWYVPIILREGGEFFTEFIIRQNIGRLQGGDTAHLGPVFFFVPVLLVAFGPFIAALFRRRTLGVDEKFLWIWAAIVFVLFSAAGSKLPHYVLPLCPALAILAAANIDEIRNRWLPLVYCGSLGAVAFAFAGEAEQFAAEVRVLGTVLIVGGIVSVLPRDWSYFARAVAAWCPFVVAVGSYALPSYWEETHGPVREMAYTVGGRGDGLRLFEYRTSGMGEPMATWHPSLIWYVRTPITGLDWPDQAVSRDGVFITRRRRLPNALTASWALDGNWGEFEAWISSH